MADKKLIDLTKKVQINLAKVTSLKIRAQVGLLDDVSGSASGMHSNGITQRLFDRLFAVAFEFDDNATLDAWAFDTGVYELEPVKESMFGNYVQKYIVGNKDIRWGGTAFAPGIEAVIDHYYPASQQAIGAAKDAVADVAKVATGLFGKIGGLFGKKEAAPAPTAVAPAVKPAFSPVSAKVKLPDPAFCMLVTDGDNGDQSETIRILEANKDKQIFFMMIGIKESSYGSSFGNLKQLADRFPNVDWYNAGQIDNVDDDVLYSSLFTKKFITWYENVRKVA